MDCLFYQNLTANSLQQQEENFQVTSIDRQRLDRSRHDTASWAAVGIGIVALAVGIKKAAMEKNCSTAAAAAVRCCYSSDLNRLHCCSAAAFSAQVLVFVVDWARFTNDHTSCSLVGDS